MVLHKKVLRRIGVVIIVIGNLVGNLGCCSLAEHSVFISAESKVVFEQINDLRNWEYWDPFFAMDSTQARKFEGGEAGKGAAFYWESSSRKIGKGNIVITESSPYDSISVEILFLRGNQKVKGTFRFKEDDKGTNVIVQFDAKNNPPLVNKFSYLMTTKWLDQEFEKGLIELKRACENTRVK